MRLLLDTVTFIWAVTSPERISRTAMSALRSDTAVRELSVISLSEIAVKNTLGKLTFNKDDVVAGAQDLRLRILPFTSDHALQLFNLPLHHGDPFDRQIIAQALREKVAVVTCDEKFDLYKGLRIVW